MAIRRRTVSTEEATEEAPEEALERPPRTRVDLTPESVGPGWRAYLRRSGRA